VNVKKKPTTIYSQSEYPQFGSQSESVHNLHTVKQIANEIITEEPKQMKQTSYKAPIANSLWPTLSSNTSYYHYSAQSPARNPSTYGIHETLTTYQYSVPTANQYTTLSSCQELQSTSEVIPLPNDKYPSRSAITQKRKQATRSS